MLKGACYLSGVMIGYFFPVWFSLMAGCHRDSGDFEKAKTLALHGQDDEAILLYENLIAENPESPEGRGALEELQKMYENYFKLQ